LRQAVAIVPQETVLFNDTIARNIAYAKVGASQLEIDAAARSAHIHGFIISLPQGYDKSGRRHGRPPAALAAIRSDLVSAS
jgi:ABC-type transport system involved in Fe-S cluster assembly fused permease/ATPase subunit